MDALSPGRGDSVVDVGCGAGQTLLQLADRVGPEGRVVGVDLAPALLDVARERARDLPQVSLVEADAQTLDVSDGSVDGLFSRFGVMAFSDPCAAFGNLHRMLRSSGRLAFVCWRALEDNELDLLPLRAAGLEARADATPFSLADPQRLRTLLEGVGFRQVSIEAHDEVVSSGDLDDMAAVLLRVGALGKILRESPHLRTTAEPRVRAALSGVGNAGRVGLRASTWIVTARAGGAQA